MQRFNERQKSGDDNDGIDLHIRACTTVNRNRKKKREREKDLFR